MSSCKYEIYVRALLDYREELEEKKYVGLWHLPDELADLDEAVRIADLTDRQREIIRLIFVQHKEQAEVANLLLISQPMVHKHVQAAIRKIANIYQQWEALDYVNE